MHARATPSHPATLYATYSPDGKIGLVLGCPWQKMYEKEKPLRTAALGYDNDEEFQGAETVESFETIEQIISVEEVLD